MHRHPDKSTFAIILGFIFIDKRTCFTMGRKKVGVKPLAKKRVETKPIR